MGRAKRDGKQLHACLLRCTSGLVVIAAFAGGDNIDPAVCAALAQWVDVIPGEQKARELLATIQAHALVTPEQGFVIQRWNIVL